MRKILGILASAVVLLVVLPAASVAATPRQFKELKNVSEYPGFLAVGQTDEQAPDYGNGQHIKQIRNQRGLQQSGSDHPRLRFRGVWGFAGDNESDGYIAGVITKGRGTAHLYGIWNTIDNESGGKVFGVMRHGYFNGRVTSINGTTYPIAGLYKVDREKHTLKMRWITPRRGGWAAARLGQPHGVEDTTQQ
ncbi:MAG TPA: hypothetical protein ENL13_02320 [Thermoplasmatales archaeon]|nr:hypothetical protein [Thermoplasmatales archaeon]